MPETDADKGMGLPVGGYLKSVREARGLTLDQASRVTKISKGYLAAIEEGEFDKLPNAAYIKGFLRLYAGYLSLDGDDVVRRYEGSLPPVTRPQPEAKGERSVVEIEKTKFKGPSRWAIPALLLALVILAAVFLTEPDQPDPVPPPQPPPAAAPAPVAPPVMPRMTSAARGTAPAAPGESLGQLPPAQRQPGGVILRLRFNRDTWLSITIDDSISQRYELKAGDVIEWKGSRAFVVDAGDGGAVEAEFNGEPSKPLGVAGQQAHVEFKEQ